MNYIKKLEQEKKQLLMQLFDCQDMALDIALYLSSEKFQGTKNDFVHVSTDIRPKVIELLNKIRLVH